MIRVPSLLSKSCALLAIVAGVVVAAPTSESCESVICPGPLNYYKSLGCTPIFKNDGDCCASMYNCTHVETRSKNKCYVNGHEYNDGEELRDEDANPCDIGCTCTIDDNGVGSFTCAEVDCFFGPTKPGCYRKQSPAMCCPGEEVCPENPEDRPKCVVNGRTYLDGEYFEVESDPELNCNCMPGYTGENIEPFCKKPNHPYCAPDFRTASNVYDKCAPVFYSTQSVSTGCSVFSRCPSSEDKIIPNPEPSDESRSNDEYDTCVYGNMTMRIGDELNMVDCVKCKCEVGPTPTCQRIEYEKCKMEEQNA